MGKTFDKYLFGEIEIGRSRLYEPPGAEASAHGLRVFAHRVRSAATVARKDRGLNLRVMLDEGGVRVRRLA